MNTKLLEKLRSAYAYPPAMLRSAPNPGMGVVTFGTRHFISIRPAVPGFKSPPITTTSWALDAYHYNLLSSSKPDDIVTGVASVVFWGNFANQFGKPIALALPRVGWLLQGKNTVRAQAATLVADIAKQVQSARGYLGQNKLLEGLDAVRQINFVGTSFASKVMAFLDPTKCGVLDKVIANRLLNSADASLRRIKFDPNGFVAWCLECSDAAAALNQSGATWQDWDNTNHPWRAVDVERAVFGYRGDPAALLR